MPLEKGGSTARMMRAYVDPTHREDEPLREERVCTTWAERDPELCGCSSPVFGIDGKFVGVLLDLGADRTQKSQMARFHEASRARGC